MTEEEYFRKNYPDSCYGDKPLSPYWDFFQDGVEFGERQSEKKIVDLEKENAELKGKECWKSCEYANPKAELIGQHIKDVQNLTKAKEKISKLLEVIKRPYQFTALRKIQLVNEAVQFLQVLQENE